MVRKLYNYAQPHSGLYLGHTHRIIAQVHNNNNGESPKNVKDKPIPRVVVPPLQFTSLMASKLAGSALCFTVLPWTVIQATPQCSALLTSSTVSLHKCNYEKIKERQAVIYTTTKLVGQSLSCHIHAGRRNIQTDSLERSSAPIVNLCKGRSRFCI